MSPSSPRFKTDENLSDEVAARLRAHGFDAVTAREQGLGGSDDRSLLGVCSREGRAVLTLDLDFADIRRYPPEGAHGIVVFRLARQDTRSVERRLDRVIELLRTEPLAGRLWIVDEASIRVRGGE
ncbi:MAG: hypothetical protein DYG93_13400 [Leptolyngbya sp. PLA2]|nr:hypothetical protein [Leptolyngbya sp.]MCE7972643.1 hypothetical protein [Leptolyngbya sp. PL-A2]MCQ3941550.1 hypothetical protein [cyanobacterium CYA1]MDL1905767.1 hypothetical protein [Synechococcales cyanobacterium CNB]